MENTVIVEIVFSDFDCWTPLEVGVPTGFFNLSDSLALTISNQKRCSLEIVKCAVGFKMSFLKLPRCGMMRVMVKDGLIIPESEASASEVLLAHRSLPPLIQRAGPISRRRFLEFFAAQIRNPGTREAYARDAARFFDWCDQYTISSSQYGRFL
ncbi:hypothetical protein Pr1d_35660 [Bythopirellula goksoeyrii]|uniref:Core-binding (CB) domain-containing protein n=1 Tax=Bythopirellula goksoeyrii TaxID=1400387 RepID=A0A5B9QB17_9BACT|nr:hypothetical protein Pr1d_35660 [Bythopirellula goksoeyrii]